MEKLHLNEDYVHYNHTDPCRYVRWTARESYQFMYGRPWQLVNDFYLNVVQGSLSLPVLFGAETLDQNDTEIEEVLDETKFNSSASEDRSGRWARTTFKIVLSYHGASFDGWQKQPGLKTVQSNLDIWDAYFPHLSSVGQPLRLERGKSSHLSTSLSIPYCLTIVEWSLGDFVDEKKAQQLKDKGLPVEGCAVVAGRTDKGVTGLQQVCSFYTWRTDVKPRDIEDAINHAAPGKLRVISVSEVSRVFHPNFSAKWRRYLYIFPLTDDEYRGESSGNGVCENFRCNEIHNSISKEEFQSEKKSFVFSVRKVNQLLQNLEGKLLSYKMFARDTKASRNDGPPTECFIYHAQAMEARLPISVNGEETRVMCVELVANRFLRKMVRVLVATSIREAAAGAEDNVLLKLMEASCRRATAPPAPPDGLCLVDVGYAEFNPEKCLIRKGSTTNAAISVPPGRTRASVEAR